MKLFCSSSNPAIAPLLLVEFIKDEVEVVKEWGDETKLEVSKVTLDSVPSICRYLARVSQNHKLYGINVIEQLEVDNWISFSFKLSQAASQQNLLDLIDYLSKVLSPVSYLVGNRLTLADLYTWSTLHENSKFRKLDLKSQLPDSVYRWYSSIIDNSIVSAVLKSLPELSNNDSQSDEQQQGNVRKEEGKFVELPGAEIGKVVVRFPPEASGYLHIGHAKAALLNQYYKDAFQGKLVMRFDDTNPAKEKVDFEKVILEDIKLLQLTPDIYTHTSDYFDLMLDLCQKLIKDGKAYVDDTDAETMKLEREQCKESANRNNSIERNLELWNLMKSGAELGQKCCVRAKIDMKSPNGCLRDPTIYRCKNEPHPKTGTKYKVYPTYDFACPIVDSIEGVTHCLRTMEYHDRDDQFYWFIKAMNLRCPYIWEYSRLNMTNTVLSKRKLTWFVDSGLVDGWDDPRLPTVRGVLRRGMTVEGLKQFIVAQGSSRSVVVMEWDKIWAFNRKVIDPVAPRFTAVDGAHVPVLVDGAEITPLTVAKHPKNPDVGTKTTWTSPKILIDYSDAEVLKEGENTTFINWGNLRIKKVNRNAAGRIENVEASLNLDDKDYKKTLKITWLADNDESKNVKNVPCTAIYYDHIISKAVLGKEEDFKEYIGYETMKMVKMIGDPELINVQKSEIIQLQRKGFFICDSPYKPPSNYTGVESPIVLIFVPDGHTKEMPTQKAVPKKSAAEQQKKVKVKDEPSAKQPASLPNNENTAEGLNALIQQQGDKVRKLKSDKAPKEQITAEVQQLLNLKNDYKSKTGQDWKPGATPSPIAAASPAPQVSAGSDAVQLNSEIKLQGDKVRRLKSEKADKNTITNEVKILLGLKEDYKKKTGSDWTPDANPVANDIKENKTANNADGTDINNKIVVQGDLVRQLKASKADKAAIDSAVKVLLQLKEQYKNITGQVWDPKVNKVKDDTKPSTNDTAVVDSSDINNKIVVQGDLVRQLKASKADKTAIDSAVKVLLQLKEQYKNITGQVWDPKVNKVKDDTKPSNNDTAVADINNKITQQGDVVRKLKAEKAEKSVVDSAVKVLLQLKADYKKLSGKEWKPPAPQQKQNSQIKIGGGGGGDKIDSASVQEINQQPPAENAAAAALSAKITEVGDKIRKLKAEKVDKNIFEAELTELLKLKSQYKELTGHDWQGATQPSRTSNKDNSKNKQKTPAPKASQKEKPADKEKPQSGNVKKQTRLGMEARKEDNLADWYSQVITKGELIEYYDVSGCYILRPWSFAIWDVIRDYLDKEIKKLGVQNCYFPIFVSRSVLEKEKTHIADFAPEVAWVTKSGDSDLAEPIAIRPTSETVMYPAYAKWLQSYRDLPIKLNQWNNVVRWEFKHPQPFIRTREFLWQEGHTAFATAEEAQEEVYKILDLYASVYTDLLAVPVVRGRKTEKEKFAGGDFTTTVEAFISGSGRGIQGATSHFLGQNFSKMFEIVYDDPETQEKKYVFQNSWGLTTRTIGVMIMVHADNQGLVLPPRVAAHQVVIVPCGVTVSLSDSDKETLINACKDVETKLSSAGVRVHGDYRDNYSPGWKFNHWELKGVPIRLEIGPKDIANKKAVLIRRDTGSKITVEIEDVINQVQSLLENIHASLLKKATDELKSHTILTTNWSEFVSSLDKKCILLSPFCGNVTCEDNIKQDSAKDVGENVEPGAPAMGAKSLCIPFDQPNKLKSSDRCIHPDCKNKPTAYTLFGRSY